MPPRVLLIVSSGLSLPTHLQHLCFCHNSFRFLSIFFRACKNVLSPKALCPVFFFLSCLFFFLLIISRPLWCILLIGAVLILTMFIFLVIKICLEVGRWTKFATVNGEINRCFTNNWSAVTYWVKYSSNSWNQSIVDLSVSWAVETNWKWHQSFWFHFCKFFTIFSLSCAFWYDDYDPSTAPPPLGYRWSILIFL